jgi:aminomethyltransferase
MTSQLTLSENFIEQQSLFRSPGVEQYRVPGGGSIVVQLFEGDRITLVDLEGSQLCELSTINARGQCDLGMLGKNGVANIDLLRDASWSYDESKDRLIDFLRSRSVDVSSVPVLRLFGDDAPANSTETFIAAGECLCLVRAPGAPMLVHEQQPPTDLRLIVTRNNLVIANEFQLPPPLAPIVNEFRVHRGTALAYEVKAGEYIQIIDVAGRQCSDFLGFDRRKIESGIERGIDGTATRTLMGNAYPQPGLYSKFFDQDFQPLVEVVRDTVGRHDTFALACTAKYYADKGYPGHANCSDNFNAELSRWAIAPRPGWPAVNFFYNTRIDCRNVMYSDEPWSRPGDYVLLRALQDLVCASSACPDDIDPANAWNPTDIHVRVYSQSQSFSKGVAQRMTPTAEPRLTRQTAFHSKTSALTRNFVEYRGFWLPANFPAATTIDQYHACREGVVIMDLSALRKFEILGPDAEALLQATMTRNVRKLAVGQVVYSAICHETGGMIDDGTLFRLGENNFRWIGGDDYDGIWLREQSEKLGLKVSVKSATDQIHNLSIQGPKSRELLRSIVWTSPGQPTLDELGWFRFTIGRLGDSAGTPLVVSRTGYTGELGFEVWCHPQDAASVWDVIWEAGKKFDLTAIGLDALDMLRIESGLIFAGYEFDDQIDPFEAGIGFAVALDTKPDDYIGKTALQKRKANPQRVLVGLELEGNEVATHGDCVHVGRQQVGVITSGTRSPLLGKNIALCRMAVEYSAIGTAVEVGKLDGHQKRIKANVVRFPFYDPEKKRPRS